MSTHNIGFARELMDLESHFSLLAGFLLLHTESNYLLVLSMFFQTKPGSADSNHILKCYGKNTNTYEKEALGSFSFHSTCG